MALVASSLTTLIGELMASWTPDYLQQLIRSGSIPDEYIQRAVSLIAVRKSLLTVEKGDLILALRVARPDLHVIVEANGEAADRWLDIIAGRMAIALIKSGIRRLTGG